MAAMRTFIDANVLLETLLESRKKPQQAAAAIEAAGTAVISPLVVHLYVHFGRKEKHAVGDLLVDLEAYEIQPITTAHVQWAKEHRQDDDFEDALQVACAVMGNCENFVTLDAGLAKKYRQFINTQLL